MGRSEKFSDFLALGVYISKTVADTAKVNIVSDNVAGTSNWSNFGRLSRRAGLSAIAGLSCMRLHTVNSRFDIHIHIHNLIKN